MAQMRELQADQGKDLGETGCEHRPTQGGVIKKVEAIQVMQRALETRHAHQIELVGLDLQTMICHEAIKANISDR